MVVSDEGEIETFTILYVTPDGFLPPVALALIRIVTAACSWRREKTMYN